MGIYDHRALTLLARDTGLIYYDDIHMLVGGKVRPGVHHTVRVLGAYEAARIGHEMGYDVDPVPDGVMFGWLITEEVWRLLRDPVVEIPPSQFSQTAEERQALCLQDLVEWGY